MRSIHIGYIAALVALSSAQAADPAIELRTLAEQTDFKRTGRYDETVILCHAFQQAYPTQARCFEFGRTPEGRSMLALAVSADGVLDANSARTRSRPVFLMQGGIHAGEIDGKDAGFLAVRDLLEKRTVPDMLSKVTVVFVPVFNVDGHERFGRNNRPNQVGPEEMGWRTTAQNLNLNRDYVKAEAPEMQAMLRLLNDWDPIVYADLHVTDGAQFEHDISITVSPTLAGDADMRRAGISLRDAIVRDLRNHGSFAVDFYPTFVRDDDPASGFAAVIFPPRFSNEYWALRNRIGVLVETHSWKDYKTRVQSTYRSILSMVRETATHGGIWRSVAAATEKRTTAIGGQEIALAYDNTTHVVTVDFRGYRYTREPSPISGALMTKYDIQHPEIWRVPYRDEVQPSLVIAAPRGGYVVPTAWTKTVADKLSLHHVKFERMGSPMTSAVVQTFRATRVQQAPASNESRAMLTVQGDWRSETRAVPAGSLYVPIAQPNSRLAMTLLEPKSPDSLLAWGFFNGAFERKEYMEAYVAEQVAFEMLSKDPALKTEFDQKVADDPAFAKSPQARLDFFYRRHPSWDERFNLYPIYRVETRPPH